MPGTYSPPVLRADIPHWLWDSILWSLDQTSVFPNISAGRDRLWIGHTEQNRVIVSALT